MKFLEEIIRLFEQQLAAFETITEGSSSISTIVFLQFISTLENILNLDEESKSGSSRNADQNHNQNRCHNSTDNSESQFHIILAPASSLPIFNNNCRSDLIPVPTQSNQDPGPNYDHPNPNEYLLGSYNSSVLSPLNTNSESELNDLKTRVRKQLGAFRVLAEAMPVSSSSSSASASSSSLMHLLVVEAQVSAQLCSQFIRNIRNALEPKILTKPGPCPLSKNSQLNLSVLSQKYSVTNNINSHQHHHHDLPIGCHHSPLFDFRASTPVENNNRESSGIQVRDHLYTFASVATSSSGQINKRSGDLDFSNDQPAPTKRQKLESPCEESVQNQNQLPLNNQNEIPNDCDHDQQIEIGNEVEVGMEVIAPNENNNNSNEPLNLAIDIPLNPVPDPVPAPVPELDPAPDLSLQNDLILLGIFKYLPSPDLIRFRRVSLKWEENATTTLLKRKSIEIKFCYSGKMKKFYATTCKADGSSSRESLVILNSRISRSRKFPCSNFYFKGGNMGAPEVLEFFRLQGRLIRKIKLELTTAFQMPPMLGSGQSQSQNQNQNQGHHQAQIQGQGQGQSQGLGQGSHGRYTSITTFRHMLLQQLPFLEELHLKKFPVEWRGNFVELFPEPSGSITLPRLKILQVSRSDLWNYTKIMGDILRAAVNLQKVEGFNFELKHVDVFLLGQKIHMIKSITYYGDYKCIGLYEKFANAHPTLKQIQFDMEYFYKHHPTWPRVTETINKVLDSSKNSLEEIVIFNSIGFLPSLHIPRCENVRNLVVEDQYDDMDEDRFRQVFSFDFNLADTFPSLQVFTMNLRNLALGDDNDEWEDFFPGCNKPVVTAKRLEIGYQLNSSWLKKLTEMFPHITRLEMQRISNFPQIAKELWNFPKLRKAKFEIDVGNSSSSDHGHGQGFGFGPVIVNSYPGLDAAFTGFGESTVVSLKELSRTVDLVEVENLRVGPSILQLTDLKLLWLRFSDVSSVEKGGYPALLSHVTALFGFRLMTGLRVKVSCCAKEARNVPKLAAALESMVPFVEFVSDNLAT